MLNRLYLLVNTETFTSMWNIHVSLLVEYRPCIQYIEVMLR